MARKFPRDARSDGMLARASRIRPSRLISRIRVHCASSRVSKVPGVDIPAFATTTSRRPHRRITVSTAAVTPSGVTMSAARTATRSSGKTVTPSAVDHGKGAVLMGPERVFAHDQQWLGGGGLACSAEFLGDAVEHAGVDGVG